MGSRPAISFVDKAFCFTGKLSELLRKDAEREVRARGGMSMSVINDKLDYLVVGDIPAPGWAFGSYGNKIQAALTRRAAGHRKPRIVAESDFISALAAHAPLNDGAVDTKVIIATFESVIEEPLSTLRPRIDRLADALEALSGVAVKVKVFPSALLGVELAFDLLGEGVKLGEGAWDVRVRAYRGAPLSFDTGAFAFEVLDIVGGLFPGDEVVDVKEYIEGSARFVEALRQMPRDRRVEVLSASE